MKKTLQIALGIIAATVVLWLIRLAILRHFVYAAVAEVSASTQRMVERQEMAARGRKDAIEYKKAKAAAEFRAQREAACYIITSDGRKLTCPQVDHPR